MICLTHLRDALDYLRLDHVLLTRLLNWPDSYVELDHFIAAHNGCSVFLFEPVFAFEGLSLGSLYGSEFGGMRHTYDAVYLADVDQFHLKNNNRTTTATKNIHQHKHDTRGMLEVSRLYLSFQKFFVVKVECVFGLAPVVVEVHRDNLHAKPIPQQFTLVHTLAERVCVPRFLL